MYDTKDLAEEALIDAWIRYDYRDGQGPVAVYRCDACSAYHLTSQGSMNERLAERIRTGKIKLNKEANRWLNKINKR